MKILELDHFQRQRLGSEISQLDVLAKTVLQLLYETNKYISKNLEVFKHSLNYCLNFITHPLLNAIASQSMEAICMDLKYTDTNHEIFRMLFLFIQNNMHSIHQEVIIQHLFESVCHSVYNNEDKSY